MLIPAVGQTDTGDCSYRDTTEPEVSGQMPNRRAARQAASELSGNLGSNPKVIRKSEFEGGPYGWKKI